MAIEKLIQVAQTLLQPQDFIELKEFDTYLLSLKRPFEVPVDFTETTARNRNFIEKESQRIVENYTEMYKAVLDIGAAESSGIPILGLILSITANVLSTVLAPTHFKCQFEFPVFDPGNRGKNPSSDGAVVAINSVDPSSPHGHRKPVVLYEYKPRLHQPPDPKDVLELFIQGFYSFKEYKIQDCMLCLTDLQTWWYYKVQNREAPLMKVEWVSCLTPTTCTDELQRSKRHVEFIAAAVHSFLFC